MKQTLLSEISAFLAETGMSKFRFGYRATKNGRLVERLENGSRVWPETEQAIRKFIATERQKRSEEAGKGGAAA